MSQAESKSGSDFPAITIEPIEENTNGKPEAATHHILEKPETIIGRDESMCDIVIDNRTISRQHIRITQKGQDEYVIEDLNSRNGTWVNGTRLESTRILSDGDEIHLGLTYKITYTASNITVKTLDNLPNTIPGALKGKLKIDTEARRVFVNDREIDPPLSLPQYRLLELLYMNSSRVCTREEVVDAVWPEARGEGVSEQAIDALVRRLRDRLAEVDPDWQYVVTVRGHGFRLDNPNND